MSKKLYRSSRQRVFAGVCGGLAEYFNLDAAIIRLIWVVTVFWGTGLRCTSLPLYHTQR